MGDSGEEQQEAEFVPEEEVEDGPALIKRLRERLKKAVEEKQEYLDGWQRARADLINYKKEDTAREAAKEERFKADLVEELLPVLDSLELSVKHANEENKKGLVGMYQQFLSALKSLGVEKIAAEKGQGVDHNLHEALREETVEDESQDHTIVNV